MDGASSDKTSPATLPELRLHALHEQPTTGPLQRKKGTFWAHPGRLWMKKPPVSSLVDKDGNDAEKEASVTGFIRPTHLTAASRSPERSFPLRQRSLKPHLFRLGIICHTEDPCPRPACTLHRAQRERVLRIPHTHWTGQGGGGGNLSTMDGVTAEL